ncbi:magnesium/cobalt transporter CorA [Stieleria mannarensis]|uniref:magnesium/cobalt transporter CorA n=1 Tax=Stieleria mannarensis TaxID=2755585 RepID=UPI0016037F52|nr:magnesium/cobalt transporter CorA [Rhodopirellula sp. JC639]
MATRHSHTAKRSRKRFRRQTRPGTPPGAVVPHPDAPPPLMRLVTYGSNDCSDREVGDLETITAQIKGAAVTWVDVNGLGDADVVMRVGELFGLHHLALEDVVNVHQRPKVELYGDHLFMIARALPHGHTDGSVQVAMFMGRDFVVSFRERDAVCLDAVHQRILAGKGKIRTYGADYLLYALLDAVIDDYFPALEKHGENLDRLDSLISAGAERNLISQVHQVRTDLLSVRRAIWPLRDAINALIRDSGDLISDETDLYLRDCYDHIIQIMDVIETDRELCSDLRDFYLTVVSNRMNQVMKFLTIIATLFMPLGFIAGLYGMNFNSAVSTWNMPELNWTFGYPFALALMAATATTLVLFFWRKGWLS